jgi:hypothetical protein
LVGRSIDVLVPQRLRKNHEAFSRDNLDDELPSRLSRYKALRQSFLAHPIKRPMSAGRD